MRINHNIPALNAHRILGQSNIAASKNLERLSSGKRINRAADDAAGLAISEKMNAQIRGLQMASRNSMDGVSLVQTAEGAMGEVHSMLQRMRELSVQAANGTMSPEDRNAVQDEINQLTSEINRVGNGTEFNKLNLLQGNQGPSSNTIQKMMSTGGPAEITMNLLTTAQTAPMILLSPTDNLKVKINGVESVVNLQGFSTTTTLTGKDFLDRINDALGDNGVAIVNDSNNIVVRTKEPGGAQTVEFTGSAAAKLMGTAIATGVSENPAVKSSGSLYFEKMPEVGSYIKIGDTKIDFYDSSKEPYYGNNLGIDISGKTTDTLVDTLKIIPIPGVTLGESATNKNELTVQANVVGYVGNTIPMEGTLDDFNINLQVGANSGQYFRLEVGDVRSLALRISSDKPTGNPGVSGASYVKLPNVTNGVSSNLAEYALDVSDENLASSAIEVFNNAIIQVAQERSKLGAIQNRLEKTIANLDNTAENLTAAMSRIADADMALEMSNFTKMNVLQQSGMSMLAQANQQPQLVLKLLGN